MRALFFVFALSVFAPGLPFGSRAQTVRSAGAPLGVRMDGEPLRQLASSGTQAVVLFFVATDCPVSNRTFPEMKRLREEFRARGVTAWFVYPNEGETPVLIRAHQQAFDPGGTALSDPEAKLVRLAGAVATPEVAVLAPNGRGGWKPAYVGRVDDRYVRLGLERPAPTEHFGEQAILAVLAGREPRPAVGQPVGCAIMNRSAR